MFLRQAENLKVFKTATAFDQIKTTAYCAEQSLFGGNPIQSNLSNDLWILSIGACATITAAIFPYLEELQAWVRLTAGPWVGWAERVELGCSGGRPFQGLNRARADGRRAAVAASIETHRAVDPGQHVCPVIYENYNYSPI